MSDSQSPKRRRGGQPGNQNAVKHGYYSRTANRAHLIDSKIAEIVTQFDEVQTLTFPKQKGSPHSVYLTPETKVMLWRYGWFIEIFKTLPFHTQVSILRIMSSKPQ